MSNILITGANRGLGLEFVQQYLAENHRIFACCRAPEKAQELNELAIKHEQLSVHKLDVLDDENINSLAKEIANPIDILINNSGIYGKNSSFGDIDYESWVQTLQVNTIAPVKIVVAFVEQLSQGQDKKLVIITSQMGSIADNTSGGGYIYRSSKAAVNMVGKSLSHDLKDRGVTVLLVHPGWVATDMGGPNASLQPPESISGMRKVIENAKGEDSGKFFNYDGREIAW